MSDASFTTTRRDRLREVLDWAVFSLGLVSLGVAVGATVLTKTTLLG